VGIITKTIAPIRGVGGGAFHFHPGHRSGICMAQGDAGMGVVNNQG
jgi:hypothetical protein